MKIIGLNSYDEVEHRIAQDERNVYLSYSQDSNKNYLNHVHSSCELLLVEKGGANYTINNTVYHLEANDVFIIGAMDPHFREVTDFPYVRYGLNLLPAYLESLPIINHYTKIYRTHNAEEYKKLKILSPDDFSKIRDIFLYLGEESTNIQNDSTDMINALLLQLSILLKRHLQHDKLDMSANTTYQSMLNIKNYIDENFYEDLSLSDLSRRFFLQPNTISRSFKSCFDVNINSYINSVRITRAVRILENSSVSITDLSAQVGYGSINTFLRQFGNKMGMSPFLYRKRFLEYAAQTWE